MGLDVGDFSAVIHLFQWWRRRLMIIFQYWCFIDIETINLRLDVVEELTHNEDLFTSVQSILGRFLDIDHLMSVCVQVNDDDDIFGPSSFDSLWNSPRIPLVCACCVEYPAFMLFKKRKLIIYVMQLLPKRQKIQNSTFVHVNAYARAPTAYSDVIRSHFRGCLIITTQFRCSEDLQTALARTISGPLISFTIYAW